tara:strand:+ start:26938 stop:27705 length:768 start_codon:yes stop_codon:yes gene_type:complete
MKNNCIVLTHVLIRNGQEQKLDIVEKTVDTFRRLNPEAYIILTGHGLPLHRKTIEKVDFVHWEHVIREEQFGSGHPYFVYLGYLHARQQGFTHAFKSRADCPSLVPNICDKMHKILTEEGTKMVVTEMTSLKSMFIGDLFLYGPLDVLLKSWQRWDCNHGGLQNYANNWLEDHELPRNHLSNLVPPPSWAPLVLKTLSYRDMKIFGCINIEDFWQELYNVELLTIENYEKYLWGAKWNYPRQITQEEFYRRKNND